MRSGRIEVADELSDAVRSEHGNDPAAEAAACHASASPVSNQLV